MAALRSLWTILKVGQGVPTIGILMVIFVFSKFQRQRGFRTVASADGRRTPRSKPIGLGFGALVHRASRAVATFHMQDGSRITCRIVDAAALLSIYIDRDYEIQGFDWSEARAIVDVGAHVGSFTVWAAMKSPHAQILAIEPNPDAYPLLLRNIRDNGLTNRVTASNHAVGPRAGVGQLEGRNHPLGARLSGSGRSQTSSPVMVETLTKLVRSARVQRIDLLKIDCEGMEYDVLEEFGSSGLAQVGALACECHPEPGHDLDELIGILEPVGFVVEYSGGAPGMLWATRRKGSHPDF